MPGSNEWSYSPLKGASVPFSRRTRYCSGVSSARHCSSVFWILVTLNSLARATSVTAESGLAVPVVDGAAAAHHQVVALVARPDAELVAVGVDRNGRLDHRRDHQHARGLLAL